MLITLNSKLQHHIDTHWNKDITRSGVSVALLNQNNHGLEQKIVTFGHAFQRGFNDMSSADRSSLTHGQATVHQPFWDCALKACRTSNLPAFGIPLLKDLEAVTEALIPIMNMPHMRRHEASNGMNLGALLRGKNIAQRRVDNLFGESKLKGLLENLEQVLRITAASLDIGILMRDLCCFMEDPQATRRVWARSYFTVTPSFQS